MTTQMLTTDQSQAERHADRSQEQEERVTIENVNVPGQVTRVDAKMYYAMKLKGDHP